MEEFIQKCYKIACEGEMNRGPGGLIYADEEHIGYLFLHELQVPAKFREKVEELVEEDEAQAYFVVIQKESLNLHISKIKRFVHQS
jgi:hypothetical protein